MKTTKKTPNADNPATPMRGACILTGLLVFFVAAAGALGIVWLRQQISSMGDYSLKYERQLTEWERKNTYIEGRVARATSLAFLEERLARLDTSLGLPDATQIVWMPPTRRETHLAGEPAPEAIPATGGERGFGEFALLNPNPLSQPSQR